MDPRPVFYSLTTYENEIKFGTVIVHYIINNLVKKLACHVSIFADVRNNLYIRWVFLNLNNFCSGYAIHLKFSPLYVRFEIYLFLLYFFFGSTTCQNFSNLGTIFTIFHIEFAVKSQQIWTVALWYKKFPRN